MAVTLFGFEFKRQQPDPDPIPSFTPKENEDGAITVATGGAYGTYVDLDGTVRTEAELVTKYREMSLQPECDSAIDEIINDLQPQNLIKLVNQKPNEDLPGLGQYYCVFCSRYFFEHQEW